MDIYARMGSVFMICTRQVGLEEGWFHRYFMIHSVCIILQYMCIPILDCVYDHRRTFRCAGFRNHLQEDLENHLVMWIAGYIPKHFCGMDRASVPTLGRWIQCFWLISGSRKNKEIKHDNSKYPTTAGLNGKIMVKPPIHHRFEIVSVMLNHRYIRLFLPSYVAKLR